MKERKLYQCEICGTEYADAYKAEQCEASHREPKAITAKRYLPVTMNKSGYPVTLDVLFDDGCTLTYKM